MAFRHQTPILGLPKIGTAQSSQGDTPLGTIVTAHDPDYGSGEFIYLKGLDTTVRGSVVHYNPDDFSTTLAVANGKGPIALAMGAVVTGEFGWYQISGKGVAKVLSGFADNADCYLTGTGGSIDDTDVAGDFIRGMKGASAIGTPAAGLAEVELARPFTDDGLAN